MHDEAMQFLREARALPLFGRLAGMRVLELGSRNVNGSPRAVFGDAKEYVGVDSRPGPGVDIIADAEVYIAPRSFDVVISTETLEHTPYPARLLECARANLKRGGMLVLTAAAPPRTPHGCNGTVQLPIGEYYTNIDPAWLALLLEGWGDVQITYNPDHGDVYALARKQ